PVAVYSRWDIKKIRSISCSACITGGDRHFLPNLTVWGWLGKPPSPPPDPEIAKDSLCPHTVSLGSMKKKIEGSAEFYSRKTVMIPSPYAGQIESLATDGDSVSTGEIIAVLTASDLDKNLKNRESLVRQKSAEISLIPAEREKLLLELKIRIADLEKKLRIADSEHFLAITPDDYEIEKAESGLTKLNRTRNILLKKHQSDKELLSGGYISYFEYLQNLDNLQQNSIEISIMSYDLERARQGDGALERLGKEKELVLAKARLDEALVQEQHQSRILDLKEKDLTLQLKNAESKLDSTRRCIESMTCRSPASGYVLRLEQWTNSGLEKFKEGDQIRRYSSFLAITDISQVSLKGYLREKFLSQVSIGQKVRFFFSNSPHQMYNGVISEIIPFIMDESPMGDSSSRYFQVNINPLEQSPRFQPESQVNFEIIQAEYDKSLIIPLSGLFHDTSGFFIITANGEKKKVEVMDSNQETAVISSGLSEGDRIMINESREK
ncbi:MAG: efflux RND transporter periplasmic adaptor subunit, partial [Candidatus Wallbacteria bacterium]|nr:efflux RND transporter periplasmic adaptor subunit [Candidatus Wallbacteria bacterium]